MEKAIRISIYSSDIPFARMLMLELLGLNKGYSVSINERNGEERIIVLDLDGHYDKMLFDYSSVIGFSKKDPPTDAKKCEVFYHRPFLISEFLEKMGELAEGLESHERKNVSAQKPKQRLCFLKGGAVSLDGRHIDLSENELALLRKLYESNGSHVSRDELGKALSSSDGNICDVYICRLRSKLEGGGAERLIYTVRGKGYMLKL